MQTNIAQLLRIDNWKFKQIKEGKATATLRSAAIPIRCGPCTLQNFQTGEEIHVHIKDIQYIRFEHVTEEKAKTLGFDSLGFMRATLAWVYNLRPMSEVVYATFEV